MTRFLISNLTLASGKCFRFRFVRFSRQVDRAETGTRTIETKKGGGDRREETLSQVKRSGSWSGVIKRLTFGRLAIVLQSVQNRKILRGLPSMYWDVSQNVLLLPGVGGVRLRDKPQIVSG